MNSLFGDATTAAPTPQTLAEAESLFSGNRSPVSSFRLGGDAEADDATVPPIDLLQPPDVEVNNGKPVLTRNSSTVAEGVGGWISGLAKKAGLHGGDDGNGGKYQRVRGDRDDDDDNEGEDQRR